MNYSFSIASLIFQCISAVLGLFFLKKFKSPFYINLIIILCLTALVELLGFYNIKINKSGLNLYNIYGLFLFNLIPLLYMKVLSFKDKRRLIISLIFVVNIFVTLTFFNIIFLNHLIIIGSITTSVYSFLYLRELLISDGIINYKKVLPFWVSVGFLVFYLPAIPFFSLLEYMTSRGLFFIIDILIIIMNLIIIYGFICSNKEEKY